MKTTQNLVQFLYGTVPGRLFLKVIMKLRLDRVVARFLWTRLSRPLVGWYVRHNKIAVSPEEIKSFRSFRDLFVRTRDYVPIDVTPEHLISPCDGWLSAYKINEYSQFSIKNSYYRIRDFLQDESLEQNYQNGICLVFRLSASDYHHYCYIDDGRQGPNHFIEGQLHSVQPIACEHFPIFTLNRRSWCLMDTDHFGPVIQTEIGALVVGGIVNAPEGPMGRGQEKGHFDLCGSTIVLLVEPGRIELLPELAAQVDTGRETRVQQGQWVATATKP